MNKNYANFLFLLIFYFYLLTPLFAAKEDVEFLTEDKLGTQHKRRILKQEGSGVIRNDNDNEDNENGGFCDFFAEICIFFCSGPRIQF